MCTISYHLKTRHHTHYYPTAIVMNIQSYIYNDVCHEEDSWTVCDIVILQQEIHENVMACSNQDSR